MTRFKSLAGVANVAAALVFAVALGGCAMDDVEFNGGIFNAMGLNKKERGADPQVAARTGIVVPPDLQRLPPPGKPAEAQIATAAVDALDDPDKKVELSKDELQAQQDEYCKKNYDEALLRGDDATADLAEGPLGPCRKSFLNSVSTNFGSE